MDLRSYMILGKFNSHCNHCKCSHGPKFENAVQLGKSDNVGQRQCICNLAFAKFIIKISIILMHNANHFFLKCRNRWKSWLKHQMPNITICFISRCVFFCINNNQQSPCCTVDYRFMIYLNVGILWLEYSQFEYKAAEKKTFFIFTEMD